MYLLKISKKGDLIDDDGIYGIPEFSDLIKAKGFGLKALLFVAYMADYDSPYRYHTEAERVRVVSKYVFGDYEWKGVKDVKVAQAMRRYIELEYDPLEAQLGAFNEKIDEYTKLLEENKVDIENAADIQKIMIGVDKVLATRQKLLDAIERRGDKKTIAGNRELSYLEMLQSQGNA
tara:strand:+ start:2061 stop:2588 length:528 start_codon:yes stop_codon:yes gene_type:complete